VEAERRFKSLLNGVLRDRYPRGIVVSERSPRGLIHYHVVTVLPFDIRTGLDFSAVEKRDYRSASQGLRDEWLFWRETSTLYGFGRTELLPVKSTAEGIARYVGSYVSKNVSNRLAEDRGARLVRYWGYSKKVEGKTVAVHRSFVAGWSSNKLGGQLWRHKVRRLGESLGFTDLEDFTKHFGPRWAFFLRDLVEAVPGGLYGSLELGLLASDRAFLRDVLLDKAARLRGPVAKSVLLKAAEMLVFKPSVLADQPDECDSLPDLRVLPRFDTGRYFHSDIGIWCTHLFRRIGDPHPF
jgi:hypothetical protein